MSENFCNYRESSFWLTTKLNLQTHEKGLERSVEVQPKVSEQQQGN